MSTCLGLYIDNNVIKYAKVTIDRGQSKIDSFGIKFYDDLTKAIDQIVEETDSYKIPICTNLLNEVYDEFQIFALLNKADIPKAIKTEFETFCTKKGYNPNVFETRYALTPNTQDQDKMKVINVREGKVDLNKIVQNFSGYRLQGIYPAPITIANVKTLDVSENSLIVNIEQKTSITKVVKGNIYGVEYLDSGSQDYLDKINAKENSYQKSYEICKETTIYTADSQNIKEEDTEYLENIMPTLYDIVGQIRKILNSSSDKIKKVYITGTGALINNIDLYFEEYLEDVDCEILKPDIVKLSPEINIKDYVEVNTAIGLALSGLGKGVKEMNFKEKSFMDMLHSDIGSGGNTISKSRNKKGSSVDLKDLFKNDLGTPLDGIDRRLIRLAVCLLIIILVYSILAFMIQEQINQKKQDLSDSISNSNAQIAKAESDISSMKTKESEYKTKTENLKKLAGDTLNDIQYKKSIPILLNRLINITPAEVQITSLTNTDDKHIEISANSKSYEQLGYFTSSIKTSATLTNVISTTGEKDGSGNITIKIEGDLP